MKTLLTSTVAVIVALTANSLVLAGGGKGSSGHSSSGSHYSSGTHYSNGTVHNTTKTFNYNTYKGTQTTQNKNVYHKYTTTNPKYKNYHLTYGKKLGKGYSYPGKFHTHWNFCCFNKLYGCYLYYCPCTFVWYYWCEPDCCYYPVWYVPYRCYVWTRPVCYCSAPMPPADLEIPAPVDVIGPTE